MNSKQFINFKLLMFVIFSIPVNANASYFNWTMRAVSIGDGHPPINLVKKGDAHLTMYSVPNNGSHFFSAGWSCDIEPDSKLWGRTIDGWYIESRGIKCVHTSGATVSQIANCQKLKNSKANNISDKFEVDLGIKDKLDRLVVVLKCD